jgi:hypothetical protein
VLFEFHKGSYRGDKYFLNITHITYIENLEREKNLKRNEREINRRREKNLITDFDAECVICFDNFAIGDEVTILDCDAHHVIHDSCFEEMR